MKWVECKQCHEEVPADFINKTHGVCGACISYNVCTKCGGKKKTDQMFKSGLCKECYKPEAEREIAHWKNIVDMRRDQINSKEKSKDTLAEGFKDNFNWGIKALVVILFYAISISLASMLPSSDFRFYLIWILVFAPVIFSFFMMIINK
jgi:hypothetical protein